MLFIKKTRFSVGEEVIRESLFAPDGSESVRLNLRYPLITGDRREVMLRNAAPYYRRVAARLKAFAKNELQQRSPADKNMPCSVVMVWEKTFENDSFVSFYFDVTVFDGVSVRSAERQTQVWERKFGLKCPFSYFFEHGAKNTVCELISPDNKKLFERERFVLRDSGFEFFVLSENGIEGKMLGYSLASEKNLLKNADWSLLFKNYPV